MQTENLSVFAYAVLTRFLVELEELEELGRNGFEIRMVLLIVEREVRTGTGKEPWRAEEDEYLTLKVCEALTSLSRIAVEREEYEWAHEIRRRLNELNFNLLNK